MPQFIVRSGNTVEYTFEASHYQILNGVVHFYDKEGDPVWIIKEWTAFRCYEMKPKNPDEFYESLKGDDDTREEE